MLSIKQLIEEVNFFLSLQFLQYITFAILIVLVVIAWGLTATLFHQLIQSQIQASALKRACKRKIQERTRHGFLVKEKLLSLYLRDILLLEAFLSRIVSQKTKKIFLGFSSALDVISNFKG